MFLDGAHLQTPFMSDLVTLADPTSPYSFLNYLKESGRLYSFYIRENFYPLRVEYDDYCRWAAAKLSSVRFGTTVTEVTYDGRRGVRRAARTAGDDATAPATSSSAPAPRRTSPRPCQGLGGDLIHNSPLPAAQGRRCRRRSRSRSSAAGRAPPRSTTTCSPRSTSTATGSTGSPAPRASSRWSTPSSTLEMTSPEYIDYFHALPEADPLPPGDASRRACSRASTADLIDAIFDLLYQKNLTAARSRPGC